MKNGLAALALLLASGAHAQAPETWLPLLTNGDISASYDPKIDETADYPFNSSYAVRIDFSARPLRDQAPELIVYMSVSCEYDQVLRLAASAYDAQGEFLSELSTQLVGDDHDYLNAQLPAGLAAALFEKVCNKNLGEF